MDNNNNTEIDLVSVDWNNLTKEGFSSIYGQLAERNLGTKTKKKAKPKAVPAKRIQVSIGGTYYLVLVHQLDKYNKIENADEKAEYKKTLLDCAEPVEFEEF